jgi:hypothetical protein
MIFQSLMGLGKSKCYVPSGPPKNVWTVKTTLDVFLGSKYATVTWQGTHWSSMKFMTNVKVSHQDLDIHRSKEAMVVAYFAIVNTTYLSIILISIVGKCSFIEYL